MSGFRGRAPWRRLGTLMVGCMLAIGAMTAGGALSAAEPPGKGAELNELSTSCRRTFASGAGITRFVWCFSDDGNLASLEYPAGKEHLTSNAALEGWCISNGTEIAISWGRMGNVGLNAPTYPSTTKVKHRTSNGMFEIQQSFAQSASTKTITVTMSVKNISGSAQNVYLTRFVDVDMLGTYAGDVLVAASRSVMATEPRRSAQLDLIAATTSGADAYPLVFDRGTPNLNSFCYNQTGAGVLSPADGSMGMTYLFGTLAANATKTVTYQYRATL